MDLKEERERERDREREKGEILRNFNIKALVKL